MISSSCMGHPIGWLCLFTKRNGNLYCCLNYVVFASEVAAACYLYRAGNKSLLKCMNFNEEGVQFCKPRYNTSWIGCSVRFENMYIYDRVSRFFSICSLYRAEWIVKIQLWINPLSDQKNWGKWFKKCFFFFITQLVEEIIPAWR